jgi:hypothetical protein
MIKIDIYRLKLGFSGPLNKDFGLKSIFSIFLQETYGIDILCHYINFGKQIMRIDILRLKLGFSRP